MSVHSVETQSQSRILRSDDRDYGTARFSSDRRRLLTITGSAAVEVTVKPDLARMAPIAFDLVRGWVLMGSQDGRAYCSDVRTAQRTAI